MNQIHCDLCGLLGHKSIKSVCLKRDVGLVLVKIFAQTADREIDICDTCESLLYTEAIARLYPRLLSTNDELLSDLRGLVDLAHNISDLAQSILVAGPGSVKTTVAYSIKCEDVGRLESAAFKVEKHLKAQELLNAAKAESLEQ